MQPALTQEERPACPSGQSQLPTARHLMYDDPTPPNHRVVPHHTSVYACTPLLRHTHTCTVHTQAEQQALVAQEKAALHAAAQAQAEERAREAEAALAAEQMQRERVHAEAVQVSQPMDVCI